MAEKLTAKQVFRHQQTIRKDAEHNQTIWTVPPSGLDMPLAAAAAASSQTSAAAASPAPAASSSTLVRSSSTSATRTASSGPALPAAAASAAPRKRKHLLILDDDQEDEKNEQATLIDLIEDADDDVSPSSPARALSSADAIDLPSAVGPPVPHSTRRHCNVLGMLEATRMNGIPFAGAHMARLERRKQQRAMEGTINTEDDDAPVSSSRALHSSSVIRTAS